MRSYNELNINEKINLHGYIDGIQNLIDLAKSVGVISLSKILNLKLFNNEIIYY